MFAGWFVAHKNYPVWRKTSVRKLTVQTSIAQIGSPSNMLKFLQLINSVASALLCNFHFLVFELTFIKVFVGQVILLAPTELSWYSFSWRQAQYSSAAIDLWGPTSPTEVGDIFLCLQISAKPSKWTTQVTLCYWSSTRWRWPEFESPSWGIRSVPTE